MEGNYGKSQYRNSFLLFCMNENAVHHTKLTGSSTSGLCTCKRYYKFQTAIYCQVQYVHTLGARDFSSAVSGFCQVFIVTTCRPSANTENSRRKREKPLVPRVVRTGLKTYIALSSTVTVFYSLFNMLLWC